jgi:hypothetical protein
MAQRVSLFNRPAGAQSGSRSRSLFSGSRKATQQADHMRNADTMKISVALSAAQARMERFFATA